MPAHLPANTRFALEISFEDEDGAAGETVNGTFRTAPDTGTFKSGTKGNGGAKADGSPSSVQSFVWTGDTAGQGWGINEELGGMRGYEAMHNTRPDFFIHSGDTIYADGPIAATVVEPDGQVWRNLVTEEVSKVAETLTEFRGRHRYNSLDANMRAMFADVPVIAQWDDHETHNNWYPGQIIDDARYTDRDVNTLAARGRQAWQENMPIADSGAVAAGTTTRASSRRASTGRSPAARSWTSSAWTCAPSSPRTRTGRSARHVHPGPGAGGLADPRSVASPRRPGKSSRPTCRWASWSRTAR